MKAEKRPGVGPRLVLDPILCRAHGLCAEELPEAVTLDEWGYPILPDGPLPAALIKAAKVAAAACPVLALRLVALEGGASPSRR